MRYLASLLFVLTLQAQNVSSPLYSGRIVGASAVTANRVVSYSPGTTTVVPHAGTGNALGIATVGGATGALIPVVQYGEAVCEFDTTPTVGHVAGFTGDKCTDTGQTLVSAVSPLLGITGRVMQSRTDVCALCYLVIVLGPAENGKSYAVVPSGAILLSLTACSTGYTEATELNGFTVIGTLAANMDVGTTGGSNTLTPAGTNSAPVLTMNSYTPAGSNGSIAMSGSTAAEASHTHSVTAAGTNGTVNFTPSGTNSAPAFTGSSGTVPAEVISWPVGVPTFAGSAGAVPAQTFTGSSGTVSAATIAWPAGVPAFTGSQVTTGATSGGTPAGTNGASATSGNCAATNIAAGTGSTTACKATAPNLTVTAQTFTGSALGTHTHTDTAAGTVAWPAGVPTNGTTNFTPVGTNSTAAFTPAGTVAWPAGVPTNATASFTPAGTIGAPAFTGTQGSVPAETFTGSAVTSGAGSSHLHAVGTLAASTPSFTGQAATLTGSVAAPSFTGTSADNRSAFIKVIFCKKD